MQDQVEQDFYKFVKAQLERKKQGKNLMRKSTKVEDEVSKNRLVNDNIQKVLLQERKRMRINKISKEQLFESRMKQFQQMGTFIDVKQFIKQLNSPRLSRVENKKYNTTLKHLESDSNDDIFDYEEIVTKSKKHLAKNMKYRTKPAIEGYLIQIEEKQFKSEEIEEGRSDNEKFYSGIDKLITDINLKQAYVEQDKQYEKERNLHRSSVQSNLLQQHKSAIQMKDEEVIGIEKDFMEKSKKVLQLLERTTKMLYNNRKRPIMKEHQHPHKLHHDTQLNDSLESKKNKSRGSRNSSILNQISPNTSTISKKILILPKLSHPSIPEEWTLTTIDRGHSQSTKFKGQLDEFLQRVDKTKEEFDKYYPTDQQINRIQQKMRRNMNKIGKQPLESLQMLGNRDLNYRSDHKPSKKNRLMQIL